MFKMKFLNNHNMVKFLICLGLVIFVTEPVKAAVNSVSSSPKISYFSQRGDNLVVTWRVQRTSSDPTSTDTSSQNYRIMIGDSIVSTGGSLLMQTTTNPVGTTETLVFSETIQISAQLARRIASSSGNVRVIRSFDDRYASAQGSLGLAIQGAEGPLSVNRVELSFKNAGKTLVVSKDQSLQAVAVVNFNSTGMLRAEWRISEHENIAQNNRERTLRVIQIPARSTGQGQIKIVSPKLPTTRLGLHQIRLVVVDPDVNFTFPSLRYYVNPANLDMRIDEPLEIHTSGLESGIRLSSETKFQWEPVENAAIYQLELLQRSATAASGISDINLLETTIENGFILVTGKILPSDITTANFSAVSLDNLVRADGYFWRVRALSREGRVLGVSKLREIEY